MRKSKLFNFLSFFSVFILCYKFIAFEIKKYKMNIFSLVLFLFLSNSILVSFIAVHGYHLESFRESNGTCSVLTSIINKIKTKNSAYKRKNNIFKTFVLIKSFIFHHTFYLFKRRCYFPSVFIVHFLHTAQCRELLRHNITHLDNGFAVL